MTEMIEETTVMTEDIGAKPIRFFNKYYVELHQLYSVHLKGDDQDQDNFFFSSCVYYFLRIFQNKMIMQACLSLEHFHC